MAKHVESEDDDSVESLVSIDETRLDKECVNLPTSYLRFATAAVDAKQAVDEAKAVLEVAKAELARNIRTKPENYKLEKVTEDAIKAIVLTHPRVKEAQAAYDKAGYDHDMMQVAVNSMEVKKRSLTLLVELHGLGYYANVKTSEDGRRAVEKVVQAKARSRRMTE